MNNTADLSEIKPQYSIKKLNLVRNANSSVKRPKIPVWRISVEQELRELNCDNDDSDQAQTDGESFIDQEKHENGEIHSQSIPDVKDDSFLSNFEKLNFNSPVPKNVVKSLNFNTPTNPVYCSSTARSTSKLVTINELEHKFVAPKQTTGPTVPQRVFSGTTSNFKTPVDIVKYPSFKCQTVDSRRINSAKSVPTNGSLSLQKLPIKSVINKENLSNRTVLFKPLLEHSKTITVNKKEYVVFKLLGKGGSSEVFECLDPEKKCIRAIKCVSLNSCSAEGYINEVKLLHKLQKCDRVITMYDHEIVQKEKQLLMVLEAGDADLSQILKHLASSTTHLPVYMLIYYWMEMANAVKQIHENGIVHSDLKPANFLKTKAGLKLIDFGIASCIQNDMTSVIKPVQEGTMNYISPEALNNDCSSNLDSPSFGKPKYKLSYKSDVWSLGCILYQLVYRKTPFQHITNPNMKYFTLVNPDHKIEYPEVFWCPVKIINTVKCCLQYKMQSRPSVDDLIKDCENFLQNL